MVHGPQPRLTTPSVVNFPCLVPRYLSPASLEMTRNDSHRLTLTCNRTSEHLEEKHV